MSVLLKRCTSCTEYTLQDACPRCGAKAIASRPAKYSPEDHYGEYRRKLKQIDKAKATGIPTPPRPLATPPASPPARPPEADPVGASAQTSTASPPKAAAKPNAKPAAKPSSHKTPAQKPSAKGL